MSLLTQQYDLFYTHEDFDTWPRILAPVLPDEPLSAAREQPKKIIAYFPVSRNIHERCSYESLEDLHQVASVLHLMANSFCYDY